MTTTPNRDLTFKLTGLLNQTPGVIAVVHASTDGIARHYAGVSQDAAERMAASASPIRAAAVSVPAEAVPGVAGAALDYFTFETAPTSDALGTFTMLTQPAQGALLVAVADDRCTKAVLAQAMANLGKSVASYWATQARTSVN